jgi:hypothetical protein
VGSTGRQFPQLGGDLSRLQSLSFDIRKWSHTNVDIGPRRSYNGKLNLNWTISSHGKEDRHPQGFLMFLQRLEQEANSLKRESIQAPHLLFDIRNLAEIEKSEHKRMKDGKSMRCGTLANLARILSEGHIATIMQTIFDRPVVANEF